MYKTERSEEVISWVNTLNIDVRSEKPSFPNERSFAHSVARSVLSQARYVLRFLSFTPFVWYCMPDFTVVRLLRQLSIHPRNIYHIGSEGNIYSVKSGFYALTGLTLLT